MPEGEPSHAEMIAAVTEAIVDYEDTDSAAPREIARRLRAVLAHLERTQQLRDPNSEIYRRSLKLGCHATLLDIADWLALPPSPETPI